MPHDFCFIFKFNSKPLGFEVRGSLHLQYILCFSLIVVKHSDLQLILIEVMRLLYPLGSELKTVLLPILSPAPCTLYHHSAFVPSYPQGGFSPHQVLCALHEVCTDQKTVGLDPWRALLIYPPQTHVFDPVSFNTFFMLSHAWHTSG